MAAGQLDREARRDRGTPRRAILATLAFAGLRIGELLALRWGDVDLAAGRLRVGASKTDAGIREVELLPALRDELASLRAAGDREPDDLVFGTTSGQQQNASNVRNRALAMSVRRANELLAARGNPPLPAHLTPHTLRRTYASLMFALGRPAPVVMEQLGHTDARLTLRVYARAMRQSPEERESLKALVDGVIGHQWALGPRSAPQARGLTAPRQKKNPRKSEGSPGMCALTNPVAHPKIRGTRPSRVHSFSGSGPGKKGPRACCVSKADTPGGAPSGTSAMMRAWRTDRHAGGRRARTGPASSDAICSSRLWALAQPSACLRFSASQARPCEKS